ncbi:MAG: hypothetical protein ACFCVE_06190 [Phycisphaerae bacterium]
MLKFDDIYSCVGGSREELSYILRDPAELVSRAQNPGSGRHREFTLDEGLKIALAVLLNRYGFPRRWAKRIAVELAGRFDNARKRLPHASRLVLQIRDHEASSFLWWDEKDGPQPRRTGWMSFDIKRSHAPDGDGLTRLSIEILDIWRSLNKAENES